MLLDTYSRCADPGRAALERVVAHLGQEAA